MTFLPVNTTTVFIPTYRNFEVNDEQLRLLLKEVYNVISFAVNIKEIGTYDLIELVTAQQWFTVGDANIKRFGFRIVFQMPAILAGATGNIVHGLTNVTQFTRIYGVANTATDSRPVPYADVTNVTNQIGILVDSTQVVISNGATSPNITGGIVVLEYLKN